MFALPSENETLGQVYIEAMASGVPEEILLWRRD